MDNNLTNEIASLQSDFNQKLDNMNRFMQSVTRPAITNRESKNDRMGERKVVLMKRPKALYIFGNEYNFGQSDRMKLAKFFTPAERGKNKFEYSRRKVLWDKVTNMIAREYTSDAAIDKIYTTYRQALAILTIPVKL